MRILQILFDLKNKNVREFEIHKENRNEFETFIYDIEKSKYESKYDYNFEKSLDDYDYIFFNNPNFKTSLKSVVRVIKQMNQNDVEIGQFTLRDVNYLTEFTYSPENYREVFSSLIISSNLISNIKFDNLIETYIFYKYKKTTKMYIGTDYWGRDLRNKWHKEDMLNIVKQIGFNDRNKLFSNAFQNDIELIKFLDLTINTKVYEKEMDFLYQVNVMKAIHHIIGEINLNQIKQYVPHFLVYQLIKKEFYKEAISSLQLYRSNSYWSKIVNKSDNTDILEIKKTDVWQKTQKFRNIIPTSKKLYYNVEKEVLKMIAKVYKLISRKKIWMIAERINTASDNSYFLYRYLKQNQADIKPYYLIDKKAEKAVRKLSKLGRETIIFHGSFKHKLWMLVSDVLITSFTIEETMMPYDKSVFLSIYKNEINNTPIVSIQHGMIIHNISPYLSKHKYNVDFITANSKYEKQIIQDTLGYKDKEVLITGMARHDNLIKNSKKTNKILFMPTWQRGLEKLSAEQFLNSSYYKKINEILIDDEILEFLISNHLELEVVMHPQFEKYAEIIKYNKESIIHFNTTKETEIPDMIAECLFLITDFSSVAVDFLFQKKNVIFYQYNKYTSHHVPSNQIKYQDIGQVVENLSELILAIQAVKENNFDLLPDYLLSYENLFEVKENINREIYRQIKLIESERYE